jgi:hypothetical protein
VSAQRIAEAAALGTLMVRPEQARTVLGWLRSSDFADPFHADAYTTIRHLAATVDRITPEAVGRELLARAGPTRADLVRVAGLLRHAPARPDVTVYARMVVEAGLRREVTAQGVLLRAGALGSVLDGSSRPMYAATVTVQANLVSASARWRVATAKRPRDTRRVQEPIPALAGAGVSAWRGRAVSADRMLAAHPCPPPAQVAEREADLVAALIAHPGAIPAVSAWLRPAAVSHPGWRPVYAATLQLHEQGRRVDAVTVSWETRRCSAAAGPGPKAEVLASRVEAVAARHPGYLAHLVAGDHLRLAADGAARGLYLAAGNPGLELPDVLDTGHMLVDALRTAAAPLPAAQPSATGSVAVHPLMATGPYAQGPVAG